MKRELSASQSVVNRVVRLSVIVIFLVVNAEVVSAQQNVQSLKEQSGSSGIEPVLVEDRETNGPSENQSEKNTSQNKPWAPPPPPPDEFDWIQLTSGEWLKGDFKVMYDYVIEFDSDELDLL